MGEDGSVLTYPCVQSYHRARNVGTHYPLQCVTAQFCFGAALCSALAKFRNCKAMRHAVWHNLSWVFTVIGIVVAFSIQRTADAIVPCRIECVVPIVHQPHESDPSTIWYDDFDGPPKSYGEAAGDLDAAQSLGGTGKSLACVYAEGGQGVGNRKIFFGDFPSSKGVRRGEKFEEIYWRIYVKHQSGWAGGGEAKLSRATSIVSDRWAQAMIAHVWRGTGDSLTLDPASGVRGNVIVTTRYNDFANLHWLGNKPSSAFRFSSADESGWWVCVESYAKLNTPGGKDGVNQLWIDGRLEARRDHLDWRGTYDAHGINAVFLEAYWNQGSPVAQTRWIDNFVISTRPIGPLVCPVNPVLIRAIDRGVTDHDVWEAQLAEDREVPQVVWKSHNGLTGDRVTVDTTTGDFTGILVGQSKLSPATRYRCRVRQRSL